MESSNLYIKIDRLQKALADEQAMYRALTEAHKAFKADHYEEVERLRAERDALHSLVDRALELFIQYQMDMDGHPDYEYRQFLKDIEKALEGGKP